jgi:hypothetical protein
MRIDKEEDGTSESEGTRPNRLMAHLKVDISTTQFQLFVFGSGAVSVDDGSSDISQDPKKLDE